MLKRLVVSNFRCLDNFAIELPSEALLLGLNGSGKSTIFDILRKVQGMFSGRRQLKDLFEPTDLTTWTVTETIELGIDVAEGADLYVYRVAIRVPRSRSAHLAQDNEPSITSEQLVLNGKTILSREGTTVYLFGSPEPIGVPWPASQTVLNGFSDPGETPFHKLKEIVQRWVVIRPNPAFMEPESVGLAPTLNKHATNLVGWYQYLSQNQKWSIELLKLLHSVWEDLDYLRLENLGKRSNSLQLHFKSRGEAEVSLSFDQLSDGERMLLLLYMIVAHIKVEDGATVFIDEPDNYIALTEVQPWLHEALDSLERGDQIVIASHHPQIVDTMGESRSLYLSRSTHSSGARYQRFENRTDVLPFSEQLTRGWIDG